METIAEPFSIVNAEIAPGAKIASGVVYNKSGDDKAHKPKAQSHTLSRIEGPFIDKLAIAIPLKDATHRGAVYENLKELLGDEYLFRDRGILRGRIGKGISGASCQLHAPSPPASWRKASCAHVSITKAGSARLEYNPANWSRPGEAEHLVREVCRLLLLHPGPGIEADWLCDPELSFAAVVGAGTVTRLDVAFDLFGYMMGELAWWTTGKKGPRVVYVPTDGLAPGSVYLGAHGENGQSANQVVIYDKAAEQRKKLRKAKADPATIAAVADKWVRIEARKVKLNTRAECLGQLPDPFRFLECARPHKALNDAGLFPSSLRGTLALGFTAGGYLGAMHALPDELHTSVKAALDTSTPPEWRNRPAWSGWPATVRSILPALFPAT